MFPETPPAEGNKVLLLPDMTHFNCSLFPSPCPIHPSQEACARSDTSVGKRQLFVNTGYEDCAKRETSASSCTSMTWPRCLSVTSTPNLVSSSCLTFLAGVGDWRRSWCIPLIHPQSITFFCVWCYIDIFPDLLHLIIHINSWCIVDVFTWELVPCRKRGETAGFSTFFALSLFFWVWHE